MPTRHLPTITFLNDLENGVANDEQGTGRRTGAGGEGAAIVFRIDAGVPTTPQQQIALGQLEAKVQLLGHMAYFRHLSRPRFNEALTSTTGRCRLRLPIFAAQNVRAMKRWILALSVVFLNVVVAAAQCSICTKTASQMGRESAEGLNGGIVYLMFVPFAVAGYIGYRWWRQERSNVAGG